jgi:6-pyruvoyltetrahydropterin/6-carboxytetrahydropterin synthase
VSFEVGVVTTFSARHHLVGDFGPASQPHGHDYRVEASIAGTGLREDGTLFDISHLQDALLASVASLEGSDLNANAALATANPTAEVVARYVFDQIAPALARQGLQRLQTRVWESPSAYASYTGELA